MKLNVDVFSTTTIAKMIGVAPKTVTNWTDHGLLPCFRIPHAKSPPDSDFGKDRRVRKEDLCRFLRQNGLALPACFGEQRFAVGLSEPVLLRLPGVVALGSVVALGLAVDKLAASHAVVIDTGAFGRGLCLAAGRELRAALPGMALVALVPDDLPVGPDWVEAGYNAALQSPYEGLEGLMGLEGQP